MTLRLACFAPIMGIGAVIKALRTSVSLSWTVGVALAVIVVIMLMSFFLVLPKFKVLQEKLDRINLIMKRTFDRTAGHQSVYNRKNRRRSF